MHLQLFFGQFVKNRHGIVDEAGNDEDAGEKMTEEFRVDGPLDLEECFSERVVPRSRPTYLQVVIADAYEIFFCVREGEKKKEKSERPDYTRRYSFA